MISRRVRAHFRYLYLTRVKRVMRLRKLRRIRTVNLLLKNLA